METINAENSVGRKLQEDFRRFCLEAEKVFGKFPFLKDLEKELAELQRNIVHPFNVAVFGRMKTGKSTLINSLIGEPLAITGVEEATATINVISYSAEPDKLNHFTVHWNDAPPETFPLDCLTSQWTGKENEVLQRIKKTAYLELYSDMESLKLCEIIDTPGTGSAAQEHEKITQDFLSASEVSGRKADAIIYVFPPVGRETDQCNLDTFTQNNCLPHSDPYNSVAVLHKWDHIYWDNGGDFEDIKNKAKRLYGIMHSMTADVIPVSAPLALASAKAGDDFFTGLSAICKETSWSELEKILKRGDEKWDKDSNRKAVRAFYSLPWATFQIIVREIARNPQFQEDTAALRLRLHDLSGIEKLKTFLDRKFFAHGEVIRQKQQYAEVNRIKKEADNRIAARLDALDTDIRRWNELFDMNVQNVELNRWIARQRGNTLEENKNLAESATNLDSLFINSPIPQLIKDEEILKWCTEISGKNITQTQVELIQKIFAWLAGNCNMMEKSDFAQCEELLQHISQLCNFPIKRVRDNANHIRGRIVELMDTLEKKH